MSAPVGLARAASILDSASAGIVCLDLDGLITFANLAAAQMLGYAVDELRAQPVTAYVQTGPAGTDVGWRADGTSFPVESDRAPLVENGRVQGLVVTFRDITERQAVDQLKDQLISIVSHELRTPLTSIRSSLGLLANGLVGPLSDKGQRMVDIAVSNTDRLLRLINDILDLERVDSGHIRMQRVACASAELMQHAADGVRAMAELAGVGLSVVPGDVRVWGDPDRLVQVLTNLLSNAIKFSPPGGTVWVEAEASADEILFRVRDQGRGIPADKLETIFERFEQVNASDAREKGGTGLGLTISRSIVKQHDGQIWAESSVGAGTTMCVALPRRASDAFESRQLMSSTDAAAAA